MIKKYVPKDIRRLHIAEKLPWVSEQEIFRPDIYGVYFWTFTAILEINFWMVLSGA